MPTLFGYLRMPICNRRSLIMLKQTNTTSFVMEPNYNQSKIGRILACKSENNFEILAFCFFAFECQVNFD